MKSQRRDFLFELGTEELPPKALPELESALREGIASRLAAANLRHGAIESFATPRRLAVRVKRLEAQQPDQVVRRRGPPVRAAFDSAGQPTRAAQAFAGSCGVAIDALGRERDDKDNEYLWFGGTRAGASTASLLPIMIEEVLNALPIPKRMRWGAGDAQFIRPVHWLVLLFGADVVPATILDAVAGRATRGHRFHAPGEIALRAPARYEKALLTRGKVIASFSARRDSIRAQVIAAAEGSEAHAAEAPRGRALIDTALLDEVTALVEWPVALVGRFEARFLELPREVLIATLQDHQRYFPVEDPFGKLLPWFVTVSNIASREPAVVRAGNERVVRPRLADAAFFWSQDRRTALSAGIEALNRVTFQAQLGSLRDKTLRIAALAAALASDCRADAQRVARAALLCKCDLMSAMVGEFPELQGVMGGYYATADGEHSEVAAAIREHYLPRHATDVLPESATGVCLALADRLDTLAGIFSIGQKPSGTRDPFGLRRAAIGVLRLVREKALDFDLRAMIEQAVAAQPIPAPAATSADVYAYVMERLRAQYLDDASGQVTTEMFDAVLAANPRSPLDFDSRLRALVSFLTRPEAASLTAANRRIANILKKGTSVTANTDMPELTIDTTLLAAGAEQDLYGALKSRGNAAQAARDLHDYGAALAELAQLRPQVDAFFDSVLVNDPDPKLRANRLALLGSLRTLFAGIADLSLLPG